MADALQIRERAKKLKNRRYAEYSDEFWGHVRIQSLTAAEARKVHRVLREDYETGFGWWVQLAIVDDEGDRPFGEDDVAELNAVDNKISQPLLDAILRHVEPDNEATVEDAKKNSELTTNTSDGTG